MTADYSEEAATAAELLAEAGMTVTLTYATESTYTPGTGVTKVEATESAAGVLLEYSTSDRNGTDIKQHDKRLLVAPTLARIPQKGDRFTIAGEAYQVIHNNVLAPTGVPLLHDVQVRR